MRPARFLAAVNICALLMAGCAINGLNFVEDKRVTIVSPRDRAKVKLPVTIRWKVHDFKITGRDGSRRIDAGYFGVYVDQNPQPPDKDQASLVRNTEACRLNPGCPGKEFLASINIHSTTETKFTIEKIPEPRTDTAQKRREFHEVTVVLLNGRGERIGESAFNLEFEVDRGR